MLSAIKLRPARCTESFSLLEGFGRVKPSEGIRRKTEGGTLPALRFGQRPLHRYIFNMRSDVPGIPERVPHPGLAVAVGLAGWFLERCRPGRHSLPVNRVHVR